MSDQALVMGAVAYDPKVVTIWEGFRPWLRERGLEFDFVLYSNYERQVEDLGSGRIQAAWNSPLAWVRARRMAEATGGGVRPLVMRDTDRDLASVVIVRSESEISSVGDLAGRRVATGAVDSPQATLLPLDRLAEVGLDPSGTEIVRFDVGVGLHGDHIGGERQAAAALVAKEVDAVCMLDGNHLAFAREGLWAPGSTRILATTPRYDHCNMTVVVGPSEAVDRFGELLLSMDYADPVLRSLLDLEGLTRWLPGRTDGYAPLERAVDRFAFYDATGTVTAADYRP